MCVDPLFQMSPKSMVVKQTEMVSFDEIGIL